MSRKRYSPEIIIGRLREAEVALSQGLTVGQICRQLSISEQTYYRWCKQYGGLKISQAKKAFHRVNILTVRSGCHFSIRHINQKAWIDINRSRFFFGLYHILGEWNLVRNLHYLQHLCTFRGCKIVCDIIIPRFRGQSTGYCWLSKYLAPPQNL